MRKRFVVLGLAAVCAAFFAAGVIAQPVGRTSFTLENDGGSALATLSLSRPDAENWGPDRLAGDVVAEGDSTVVVIDPGLGGCLYDLKAGFEGGGETRLFSVDVCRLNGRSLALAD